MDRQPRPHCWRVRQAPGESNFRCSRWTVPSRDLTAICSVHLRPAEPVRERPRRRDIASGEQQAFLAQPLAYLRPGQAGFSFAIALAFSSHRCSRVKSTLGSEAVDMSPVQRSQTDNYNTESTQLYCGKNFIASRMTFG